MGEANEFLISGFGVNCDTTLAAGVAVFYYGLDTFDKQLCFVGD